MFTVHELLYLTKALLTHTLGSRDAIASKHIVKVTDWLRILRMILQIMGYFRILLLVPDMLRKRNKTHLKNTLTLIDGV